MKRGVSRTALVAAVIVIIIVGAAAYWWYYASQPAPYQQTYNIKVYTGGTGGVYYPIGTKLAQLLTNYSNGLIYATAVSSGASVANIAALKAGDAQLIFVQNDVAAYAYGGKYMFNSSMSNLRGVATLYPEVIQIVVRADSGIRTIADLAGKKVAIGAQGSGTAVDIEQILRAGNVWNQITPVYADFNQATDQLKLGQVDAAGLVAGLGASAIVSLATTTPVNLVEISDAILSNLVSQGYTFYVRVNVPSSTYNGMTQSVNTVAVKAMLAVSSDLPKNVVYTIVKILYEHQSELAQANARAADISLNTAKDGMSIPLHDGAAQYFSEKGV